MFYKCRPVNLRSLVLQCDIVLLRTLLVRRLLVRPTVIWQKADPRKLVKILPTPCTYLWPLILGDTDGHAWLVGTPIFLVCEPQLQVLDRGNILPHNSRGRLDRKAENRCGGGLEYVVFCFYPGVYHELCDGVCLVPADPADIILAVAGVDARCGIHQLGHRTRWLHARDGSALGDSEALCKLRVYLL
ncbi:hypothetical protein ATCV1_z839R [Acanthocystis turfacea chlorella virus 1]|uniref:Uncharacterized protein z839R n=1 Tax=Chlorovirus heliozoae TaxID=322019 RepID=A7KA99_9PHYC|nr:hypothetical protein ATCV1_z839R [Acanthocystis turfacea chlorella virus 1]ABT16973.1 hypothetical protein ATCV1_z839R [Acanthocystis turfacea chlorella virus 1]